MGRLKLILTNFRVVTAKTRKALCLSQNGPTNVFEVFASTGLPSLI